MIVDIAGFLICALVITFSGTQLSRQGNRLSQLTGLSKAWIGLILMATVTSLPELVTGASSVIVVESPDLAAGNVLGSCAFNLLMLSVLDLMLRKPITSLVNTGHVVAGAFTIILLSFVATAILLAQETPEILWFSPFSIMIIIIYLSAMRSIFLYDRAHPSVEEIRENVDAANQSSLKRVLSIYSFHAVVVVLAALFLPYFGNSIAEKTGLSDSFFGTVFLAITTSLPEVVVSISALRIGSLDMAIGNLLGSNVFNVAILAVTDLLYTSGPLFAVISGTHLLSILATIIMTAVAAVGLVVRPEKKRWRLGIDTWVILVMYLITLLLIG